MPAAAVPAALVTVSAQAASGKARASSAVSMRARFCCATQSAAGDVSTRPTHSQKPFPGAHESPNPMIASPFLHDDSKLAIPTTLYLLLPISSMTPFNVTTPAMRLCTPQSRVLTPPVP